MKAITFILPSGVQVPDGKEIGDTFSAMAEFRIEVGGKVTLEEVDGEPLNPKDGEGEEPDDTTNDDTTNPGVFGPGGSMMQGLMGGAGGG